MKEFWKSVKIWQSYHHEFGGTQCIMLSWQILFFSRLHYCSITCRISLASGGLVPRPHAGAFPWTPIGNFQFHPRLPDPPPAVAQSAVARESVSASRLLRWMTLRVDWWKWDGQWQRAMNVATQLLQPVDLVRHATYTFTDLASSRRLHSDAMHVAKSVQRRRLFARLDSPAAFTSAPSDMSRTVLVLKKTGNWT